MNVDGDAEKKRRLLQNAGGVYSNECGRTALKE